MATNPYKFGIFAETNPGGPPKVGEAWYKTPGYQKGALLEQARSKAGALPRTPEERDSRKRPAITMLNVVGSVLNMPAAAISGIAEQLLDGIPGFSARDYFRRVFTFDLQEQVSWYDVLELVSGQDGKQNVFDNKWFLVLGGLALDMILDPLNFVGMGLVKGAFNGDDALKLAGKVREIVGKGILKHSGDMDAGRTLQRVFNQTFDEAIGSRMGIKLPWSRKLLRPIKKLDPSIAALKTGGLSPSRLKGVVSMAQKPKLAQIVSDAIRSFPAVGPVYEWMEKAFVPARQAFSEVLEASIKREGKMLQEGSNLASILNTFGKRLSPRGNELMKEYLENAAGIAFKDGEFIEGLAHKAGLLDELVRRAATSEEFFAADFMSELIESNKAYVDVFTRDVKEVLKTFEGRKALYQQGILKTSPQFPVKDFVKATEDSWALFSIRQLQGTMRDLGYAYDESLLLLAGAEVQLHLAHKIFTESSDEAIQMFAHLSDTQKALINTQTDRARMLLDTWYDQELKMGVPVHYVREYMARYTGPTKGKSDFPGLALGPEKEWFQFARESKSTQALANDIAAQMVDSGWVKVEGTREDAIKAGVKLLAAKDRKTLENFGTIFFGMTEAMYARGVSHYKSISKHVMIKEFKRYGFKWTKEQIPVGFKRISDKALPEFGGLVFTTETADFITRAAKTIGTAPGIKEFFGAIDKSLDWWKLMATSVNPGFHFRNFYSNHFLGWVWQGMSYFSPKQHKMATYMCWKAFGGKNYKLAKAMGVEFTDTKMMEVFAHGKTYQDLFDFAWDNAAFRRQYRMTEVVRDPNLAKGAKKIMAKLNPLSTQSFQVDAGEWLASIIESESRVAAFMNEFKHVGSMEMAWRKTKEVYVDYLKLTPFEQSVAKKVVPFWSWMKQNMVNQLKFIFTQPGRYSKIPKVKQAIEKGVDRKVPQEYQPAYFKDLWMFQLPIELPNGTPLFFNPNFPFQDLNRIKIDMQNPQKAIGEFTREALTAISPFIKLPFEILPEKGYDIFRAKQLEIYPGYLSPAPGILQPVANRFALWFPDVAGVFGIHTDGKVARMHPKMAKIFEELIPAVNNYARLLMTNPTSENFDNIFQMISYTVGIKVKPLDVDREKYYYYLDLIRKRQEVQAGYF